MRSLGFYARLAARNIQKNRRFYLPYLLTVLGTVAAFYIMSALVFDPGTENLAQGRANGAIYAKIFMTIGMVVAGLFSVVFLLYTNSFLMKRRQKELGLYSVLGMGKGNVAAMLCFESLYVALLGAGGGLAAGILLHKLVAMVLYRLVRLPVPFGFSVSLQGIWVTGLLFLGLILVTLLVNLLHLGRSRPVELLRGGETGEREPKTRWLLTVLGVLFLGFGYWLALRVDSGVEAMLYYFLAVTAVIAGTYLLFTAVSIFILKLLRRSKRYYYKTTHFINISGMLYRMKQNAVGLANICILSTMVMVMVSGTLSLYLGVGDAAERAYPADLSGVARYDPEAEPAFDGTALLSRLETGLEALDAGAVLESETRSLCFGAGLLDGGRLTLDKAQPRVKTILSLCFLTAADYAALTGTSPVLLERDQVLLADGGRRIAGDRLELEAGAETMQLHIAQRLDKHPLVGYSESAATELCHIVVADEAALLRIFRLQKAFYGKEASTMRWEARFSLGCTETEALALEDRFADSDVDLGGSGSWDRFYLQTRAEYANDYFSLAGGFLFLGIFLGILFLMAMALTIYYKQLSEGYADRRRFQIMQQVGLSRAETRRTIRGQIRTVFLLPVLVAAVHILFDFNMVTKLLSLFYLTNVGLTALCTAGTVLVFVLVYWAVYALTARTYYKIIS